MSNSEVTVRYLHETVNQARAEVEAQNTAWGHEIADMAKSNLSNIDTLKDNVVRVKNDVSWLKRFFWIVTASSLGALVTGIINLMITQLGRG